MKTEDRLTRARIQIQSKNSFFAYLSLYLKFKKNNNLPDYAGMGVNDKGELHYKKEFIEMLSDSELEGVLIHEILHLALLHLLRRKSKDAFIWNLATDICVNSLIQKNNFKLPDGCLIPDNNNTIEIKGIKIKNCDEKNAEQIYDELTKIKNKLSKQKGGGSGGEEKNGKGKDKNKEFGRFDEHIESENLTPEEKRNLEREWSDKINEAVVVSKMKGDTPAGLERFVGELHKEQINWKALLYNYITQQIPYNYTYSSPHKKSIAVGEYLPNIQKDKIDICICIDVSGSIQQKELTDFLSEIIGIAKAFKSRIDMRLLTHECKVNNDYKIDNGEIDKIKQIEIKGGGGTSHIEPFDYIQKNIPDCKCCVFLTDGYSDLNEIDFNKYSFDKFFVINNNGSNAQLKNKNCKTLILK